MECLDKATARNLLRRYLIVTKLRCGCECFERLSIQFSIQIQSSSSRAGRYQQFVVSFQFQIWRKLNKSGRQKFQFRLPRRHSVMFDEPLHIKFLSNRKNAFRSLLLDFFISPFYRLSGNIKADWAVYFFRESARSLGSIRRCSLWNFSTARSGRECKSP